MIDSGCAVVLQMLFIRLVSRQSLQLVFSTLKYVDKQWAISLETQWLLVAIVQVDQ